ncbi:MAG: Stage V sporulation protein E Required for spore cortex synthesi [Parcubacteria group bacterium Gr01-1014_46]|nr:MAG: Stage V sporulation protein E Required for spore cortex synthesi [Parcubacteria group bacterium Gr01-1014_46]
MKKLKIDIPFLILILILVIGGYLIFRSASLGLLSKQPIKYAGVAFNQTVYGLILGSLFCFITSKIDYKIYRKFAFFIFIASILVTLAVFIPGLGFEHGGAQRWIRVGTFSFQPSEFLKIGFVIFLSAWMASVKDRVQNFKYGLIPFAGLASLVGVILLLQPDTDTFLITIFAGTAIYLASGGRWKHILILGLCAVLGVALLAWQRPYIKNRINTFINPAADSLGSGYQIQQSLIAIGSGGVFGRGFGQSIQKFNVLPEPIGDSIFAVAAEEFGFVGATGIILVFILFTVRGLKIASKIPDNFGRLMVVGIVIMISTQAFVNIGAMVGVLPLSGITLPFISHGGTALFMTLAEVGIVLNISKTRKT